MPSTAWQTQEIATAPRVTAPDGSAVSILCTTASGSMISFALPPGAVSKAMMHQTVEEIWYVVAGAGRLWRAQEGAKEIVALTPGLSLTIPVGTRFQFRNDGDAALQIITVTMPPWPGDGEAIAAKGPWIATV